MTKEQILAARDMTVDGMLSAGFTMEELYANGEVSLEYYEPSNTREFYDGEFFYNRRGQMLENPRVFDKHSEGYTPFGDE